MIFDIQERAINDIQECIGCNDCMLACPIPQKENINISLLNEAVASEHLERYYVKEFVQACTQCQRCVPVCPADLSRANMILYNKLKLERDMENTEIPMTVIQDDGTEVFMVSGWTLDNLTEFFAQQNIFGNTPQHQIRSMLCYASIMGLEEEYTFIDSGDYSEYLWIVIDGQIQEYIVQQKSNETQKVTKTPLLNLDVGFCYGIEAILNDAPAFYAVHATQRSEVLRIHKSVVHRFRSASKEFEHFLLQEYRHSSLKSYQDSNRGRFRKNGFVSLLNDKLSEDERMRLFEQAETVVYEDGECILEEGQKYPGLMFIRAGFIRVEQRSKVLDYFGPNDELGLLSLVQGIQSDTTWRAAGRVFALLVPRRSYRKIVQGNSGFFSEVIRLLNQQDTSNNKNNDSSPNTKRSSQTTVMGLTMNTVGQSGLLGAERLLVIDQQICMDCNACVDACGQRHGMPRLKRTGLQIENLLFPSACRHCEDPKCLMCSVRGIQRTPSGEITIDPNGSCIGCGACAERCPYDNITMVKRDDFEQQKSQNSSIWGKLKKIVLPNTATGGEPFWETGNLLDLLFGRKVSTTKPEQPSGEDCIAVKCDLCIGYEQEACVDACPVGAVFRVSGQEIYEAGQSEIVEDYHDQ